MRIRPMIFTALFAALSACGAFLRIPWGVSSVTAQFLMTAMAGSLLGPRYGALSQALYVAAGLLGVPLFTTGGGVGYIFQPTFGFLLGLIGAAYVIGRMTLRSNSAKNTVLACICGLAVVYAVGLPYMALILKVYLHRPMTLRALLWTGMLPFLPADALKIALCAALCPTLRRQLCTGYTKSFS